MNVCVCVWPNENALKNEWLSGTVHIQEENDVHTTDTHTHAFTIEIASFIQRAQSVKMCNKNEYFAKADGEKNAMCASMYENSHGNSSNTNNSSKTNQKIEK